MPKKKNPSAVKYGAYEKNNKLEQFNIRVESHLQKAFNEYARGFLGVSSSRAIRDLMNRAVETHHLENAKAFLRKKAK